MGIDTTEDDVFTCAMEADILGGVQLGFRTVLVLSGGTKISDLANFAYQPDMIVNDCGEIELDQVFTGNCWNVGLLS
jgi:NagD protein